jgi:hypothetical protein
MLVKMVEVTVTDRDGRVVKRVAVNEDLFNELLKRRMEKNNNDMATAWFLRILRAIFEPTTVNGVTSASFTDTGGASRTQDIKKPMYGYYVTSPNLYDFLNTGYCANRLWVGYGNSPVAPTRTDYKLGNKLGEGVAGVTADETQGTVTISASFTMSADTTIYEVGLEWEAAVSGYSTCGRVLLDRTVFPDGVLVKAGQTVTIVYRFLFP